MQREPKRGAEAPSQTRQLSHGSPSVSCSSPQDPAMCIYQYLQFCPRMPKCSQYWNINRERLPSLIYCLVLRSGPCPRWALACVGELASHTYHPEPPKQGYYYLVITAAVSTPSQASLGPKQLPKACLCPLAYLILSIYVATTGLATLFCYIYYQLHFTDETVKRD